MKTFVTIFIAAFILPLAVIAQSNFKPGYIVHLQGDTVNGFVDYHGWEINPGKIKFKTTKEAQVQQLTTNDISAFGITKKTDYIRFTGKISMDRVSEVSMAEARDTSFKVATVFLKVLQKGKNLALYCYSDVLKTRYYISEQPAFVPQELVYRLYYNLDRVDQTHGRTVNEDTYARQLFAFAEKYNALTPMLQHDIENAGYREYYINQVVKQINKGAL